MTAILNEVLGYDTYDIMVDVDDVIVPWFETVDEHCRNAWDPDGLKGPCAVWSMHDHYGRTREEWENIVIAATHAGLYTATEPLPFSVEAVNRLRWYGHRVHIVTARGFMANGDNIRRWTREYFQTFGIGYDTLTFEKEKVEAQAALGVTFDFAIDDGLHNFEALGEAGVNVYLHDAPHNRHVETDRRVQSMWDFTNVVLETTAYASNKLPPAAVV